MAPANDSCEHLRRSVQAGRGANKAEKRVNGKTVKP